MRELKWCAIGHSLIHDYDVVHIILHKPLFPISLTFDNFVCTMFACVPAHVYKIWTLISIAHIHTIFLFTNITSKWKTSEFFIFFFFEHQVENATAFSRRLLLDILCTKEVFSSFLSWLKCYWGLYTSKKCDRWLKMIL